MKNHKYLKRFVRYMYRTYKNKIAALVLILLSMAPMVIDNDATALVFISMIAIPLFLSKENHIL